LRSIDLSREHRLAVIAALSRASRGIAIREERREIRASLVTRLGSRSAQ